MTVDEKAQAYDELVGLLKRKVSGSKGHVWLEGAVPEHLVKERPKTSVEAVVMRIWHRCAEEAVRCQNKNCIGGRTASLNIKDFVETELGKIRSVDVT